MRQADSRLTREDGKRNALFTAKGKASSTLKTQLFVARMAERKRDLMREESRPGSRRVENELPKMNPCSEPLTLFMLLVFFLTGSGAQRYARSFTSFYVFDRFCCSSVRCLSRIST